MPSFDDTNAALVGRSKISLYLNKEIEATKVFAEINAVVGTYLFNAYDGKYRYVLYQQQSGATAMSFTDVDIFSVDELTDAQEIISQVNAEYANRRTRDYWQVYIYSRDSAQYLRRSPTPVIKEAELPYATLSDAQVYAQRTALYEGERIRTFKVTVSHRGWTLVPSDFIQVTSTEAGVNAVLEVLEVEPDYLGNTTTLVVSGQRGLVDGTGNPGFWMTAAPVFPGGDLGTGSTATWSSGWTDAQKEWARQNCGFWCDANGFADTADIDSSLPSTWI